MWSFYTEGINLWIQLITWTRSTKQNLLPKPWGNQHTGVNRTRKRVERFSGIGQVIVIIAGHRERRCLECQSHYKLSWPDFSPLLNNGRSVTNGSFHFLTRMSQYYWPVSIIWCAFVCLSVRTWLLCVVMQPSQLSSLHLYCANMSR